MEILQQYGKEIFALAVPFLTWALNYFYKAKAKLKIAHPHSFSFLIKEPLFDQEGNIIQDTQIAHTQSLLVKNDGRDTATKIEVVMNWKPQYFNLWPARHHTAHTEEDGRFILVFDSLSPGEGIGIELLSVNRDLPRIVNVRSDQAVGRFVNMEPMEIISPWLINFARLMFILGLSASIYLTIVLVQFLILKTA